MEGAIDGVGVKYNVCGIATNAALGPVDVSKTCDNTLFLKSRLYSLSD